MRRAVASAVVVLLLGLVGCGGDGIKRVPVQGKITAKGGGPVDNASISFIPLGATKGEGGIARSDDEGNFVLTGSRAGEKAIAPGEYKVRVSRILAHDGTPVPADYKEADNPTAKESIPAQYTSIEATPLKATVPEAGGTVNIELPVNLSRRK